MINKDVKIKRDFFGRIDFQGALLFLIYILSYIYYGFLFVLKWSRNKLKIVATILCFLTMGCTGKWVWQEDYPKHKTMSFKCPRWNYNEAYDELHHIYTTKQYKPIKIKN